MNADVLEVIAEYACGTVADACALRGSCKGYRRAVDTTVRRLVCEDQPQLLQGRATSIDCTSAPAALKIHRAETGCDADPARPRQPATLHVHHHTEHLDAVRIALTCDAFPRIARLVVVACGLDGAQDEAHEGGACGPRPVSSSDNVSASRASVGFLELIYAASAWATPLLLRAPQHNKPRAEAALVRCLTDATVFEDELTDELCTAVASASRPWSGVRKLVLRSTTASTPNRARFLQAVGPQLTHLTLSVFDREWCDILAALEAVPTIVAAEIYDLDEDALPPAVAGRLQRFNVTPCHDRLPRLRHFNQEQDETWIPSEFATTVVARTPLPVADLATVFPRLRELTIPGIAPDVDPDDIVFPRTLAEVTVRSNRRSDPTSIAAATTAVVSALARHGPAHLCNLADVSLPLFADRCRDLAPLGCF